MDINVLLWGKSPSRTSMLRFLDHTQLDTHTESVELLWTRDQLGAEVATHTTHTKHKKRISMPSAGFEPAIPATERPMTYALDGMATWMGGSLLCRQHILTLGVTFVVKFNLKIEKRLVYNLLMKLSFSQTQHSKHCSQCYSHTVNAAT